ncbi:hypothetical protein QBC44DRAFT_311584 [Cladorrhinum sp. PSN332]|nr:hypothetical protein QBC44DRAFT_311584 [Cladorrhinum sp. PSN332]
MMEPAKPRSEPRVLIIGAGSAGLLMAQVLKKVRLLATTQVQQPISSLIDNRQQAGIPTTVFEQDPSSTSRPRDWNFGIYWAQSRLEECLPPDLHALIKSTQTDPTHEPSPDETLNIYNGNTGEVINRIPAPYSMRIRRRPWLELLKTGIDVRYGKKLSSISLSDSDATTVSLAFTDGTSETGTLLIGAEGAHSPTREFLFKSSPQDALLKSCSIVTTATLTEFPSDISAELAKLHPRHIVTFDPAGFFVWIGVHNRTPTTCTWMILVSWKSVEETGLRERGSEAILADLKARAEGLSFPLREAIHSVPEGTRVWHSSLTYWPTKPWDNLNGKITLAGDAAHPMTFHRGQGLGNAITDAAEFQKCLSSSNNNNLVEAVTKYEKELWVRGLEAVQINLENTIAIHNWETLLQSPIYKSGLKKDAEVGMSQEHSALEADREGKPVEGEKQGELFDD